MNITFEKKDTQMTVTLDGRLDTVTAPELEDFLKENLENVEFLVIDCEKLAYVSSAGLRVLLAMQKKLKDSMKLIKVQELVMEVFELTGFVDILVIE